jgi:hypothetical protein
MKILNKQLHRGIYIGFNMKMTEYGRMNHFKEILTNIIVEIPQEIDDCVKQLEVKTLSTIREKLQQWGFHKYLNNRLQILNNLQGLKTPDPISTEITNELCDMFAKIQEPFKRHAPIGRYNFLPYHYVLYKFFVIIDHEEYLPYITKLNTPEKILYLDQIWEKICLDLGWKYQSGYPQISITDCHNIIN